MWLSVEGRTWRGTGAGGAWLGLGHRDERNWTEPGESPALLLLLALGRGCSCSFSPLFGISRYLLVLVPKKCNKTSISSRIFKVTCIKCTKSTFLLMEWPFDNEVISDITAGEKGGISSSFSPFLQTQSSGKFCRSCCMCTIFHPAPQSNVFFQ